MERKRNTMQDKVNEGNFLFSQPTNFQNAFPTIEDINIKAIEKGYGIYGEDITSHFGKTTLGEYINCHNPSCKRGGFEIGWAIRDMVDKGETERKEMLICKGDEGSPKGRKIGRRCINHIETEIKIKYKEVAKPKEKNI